ncbi:hypothetical protein ACJX0J_028640, partial [Zea mays]
NNGVQRQRRGDDVRDTALLEPSKQPSVTFSVKLVLKAGLSTGFARSHMVKYGVEITLQRLGVSGRALSVAAFGSTKSRINGGALISEYHHLPYLINHNLEHRLASHQPLSCALHLCLLFPWLNYHLGLIVFCQVTEENLAALFINCGQVVDCRMCGDPNSVLRFAFIEFTDEEGARAALNLSGTVLGYYLVNSDDECEMCARTIYCTNIDKKVTQADLKLFFESIC